MLVAGTDSRGERRNGVIEVIGLATEKDETERRGQLIGRHEFRRGQREVAGRALHDEPLFQLRRAGGPNQKGDIAPCLGQPRPK